jgi:hypothetical protein
MCKKVACLVLFVFVFGLAMQGSVACGQTGLVGYWKFDESLGATASDSAGGDNNGTLANAAQWQPGAGRTGGAVLYDSVQNTGRVEIPTTGMSVTAGTIALWGKLAQPYPTNRDDASYFFGHTTQPSYANRIQLYMSAADTNLDLGLGDTHTRRTDLAVLQPGSWYHVALTWNSGNYVVYVNGAQVGSGAYTGLTALFDIMDIGNDGNPTSGNTEAFAGLLDEARIYNRALSLAEIVAIMKSTPYPIASGPSPKDGSLETSTWVTLSWSPGDFAVSHNIYIGDKFDDVNAGAAGTFVGNQASTTLLVGLGLPGDPYPAGLVPGTTYYWRIDEVNQANPNSPWKGNIWSFSIAPRTAYNPKPADGAGSVALNATLSWTGGFGSKVHRVYFGNKYDDVNNVTTGAMSGAATYNPGPLQRQKVYYWRVDEFDGAATYKGQVWSFATLGAVGSPYPWNGASSAEMNAILTWTPSDNAASHQVYFGTDKEALRKADPTSPEYKSVKALGAESYDPGLLAWDSTYYWRVDEVNNANPSSPWKGPTWSFTTGDFLLVDNFESYNDIDPPDPKSNRIFDKWIDGFGTTTNGALVGNNLPPYAERTIIHSGAQAMPLSYDNNLKFSEATKTLTSGRDWTAQGVTRLSLWFRGAAANAAERMYVALNGTAVVYHANPSTVKINSWIEWVIPLQAFADQGANLANVTSISLGFGTKGSTTAAGGAGKVYFDDIRLER